jgi:hypothetical protein
LISLTAQGITKTSHEFKESEAKSRFCFKISSFSTLYFFAKEATVSHLLILWIRPETGGIFIISQGRII